MKWLRELLKNAGFDESKIDDFVANFNKEVPNHFIPKDKYNELAETKKTLETSLSERDKQLEDLKKTSGNSAELKKQIEQLQEENKTAKEKFEKESKELQMSTALKLALAGKVHDPDIVLGLLDKEKIELDESGNIKDGFEDQVKSLQESKGFLFVPEKEDTPTLTGFKPFEGKGGDKGNNDKGNNIGKMLADQNKQSSANTAKAQANYFGGMSNE